MNRPSNQRVYQSVTPSPNPPTVVVFVLVLAIAGALLVLGLGLDAYNWLSPGDPVVRSWGIDWNIVGAWVAVALLPVQVLPLAVGAFVLQVLAVFLLARPALRAWLAPSPALTR